MKADALLRDMIAISSVSAESNVPMIRYAQQVLAAAGWEWLEQPYTDDAGIEKLNLVAWPRDFPLRGGKTDLALICHTDTVPYSGTAAIRPVTRNGRIFGRGACDVKGFLACALAALPAALSPVCLILTADEEVGCIGARKLAESALVRPRYAIIGEPTSLCPVRAGKGYCLADIHIQGREAHSAFPELGESAIYKAAALIGRIERLALDLKSECDPAFDPPYTTVNIGVIQGGRAKNVVAGECSFLLEWRPIPKQPETLVPERLGERGLRILRLQRGFDTPLEHPLVKALEALSGNQAATASFGTEAPWLEQMGARAVVFGPGDMRVAHTDQECMTESELAAGEDILRRVLHDTQQLFPDLWRGRV